MESLGIKRIASAGAPPHAVPQSTHLLTPREGRVFKPNQAHTAFARISGATDKKALYAAAPVPLSPPEASRRKNRRRATPTHSRVKRRPKPTYQLQKTA